MNKKIWIGLISIFLVLVLVLGIQMLKEQTDKEPEKNIASDPTSQEVEEGIADTPEVEEEPELHSEEEEEAPLDTEEVDGAEVTDREAETVETPVEAPKPSDKPSGTPQTEEPKASETKPAGDGKLYVTLSVSVKTLLDKEDKMKAEKWELVPKNGWIFAEQKVEFNEGESAFNVLLREMKKNKIHMEFIMTPLYNSNYIQGIGNLYEFDCGELSGWMYSVNDSSPNFGTSNYTLKDGDVVKLQYTCDLGRDLGFDYNE